MLTDAQIERYGRQILLPEVGGRGQARLLAARVALAGGGEAAETAAILLGRAGVGALELVGGRIPLPELSPDCRLVHSDRIRTVPDVLVDLGDDPEPGVTVCGRPDLVARPLVVGRQRGGRIALALVVGRPCGACLPPAALALDEEPEPTSLGLAAGVALGALAASETLRALLEPVTTGRLHVIDLSDGVFRATPLASARGCAACEGTA
jgi:hypothetical protein